MEKPPQHWQPFLVREGVVDAEAIDGPHDGMPDWLFPSVWEWVWTRLFGTERRRVRVADMEFIRWWERKNRASLDIPHDAHPSTAYEQLLVHCEAQPLIHLSVIDAMLATGRADAHEARELDELLHEGGSLWRVDLSQPPPALVRRVSETMEATLRQEVMRGESSGELLGRAWRAAFGRDPNPSEAYRHAVRAVEAGAGPVVLPNDGGRTLGKVVAHLRDAESSWRFTLQGRADETETVRPVREMMATLWTSQYDRHVSDDSPLVVSAGEAEAAVTLAVSLVHWFASGAVSRAD